MLRTRCGHLSRVGNLHIIAGSQQSADGKVKRNIPGKKLAQLRFKLTCVKNVLHRFLPLHFAAPQGCNMILAGDFILVGQALVWGLRENNGFRSLRWLCLDSELMSEDMLLPRDWIVSTMRLVGRTDSPLHVSADKQHAAVLAEWSTSSEFAMSSHRLRLPAMLFANLCQALHELRSLGACRAGVTSGIDSSQPDLIVSNVADDCAFVRRTKCYTSLKP